jgi:hypothetical protein
MANSRLHMRQAYGLSAVSRSWDESTNADSVAFLALLGDYLYTGRVCASPKTENTSNPRSSWH